MEPAEVDAAKEKTAPIQRSDKREGPIITGSLVEGEELNMEDFIGTPTPETMAAIVRKIAAEECAMTEDVDQIEAWMKSHGPIRQGPWKRRGSRKAARWW